MTKRDRTASLKSKADALSCLETGTCSEFLININLKWHANCHGNPANTFGEQTIRNFTLAMSVPSLLVIISWLLYS